MKKHYEEAKADLLFANLRPSTTSSEFRLRKESIEKNSPLQNEVNTNKDQGIHINAKRKALLSLNRPKARVLKPTQSIGLSLLKSVKHQSSATANTKSNALSSAWLRIAACLSLSLFLFTSLFAQDHYSNFTKGHPIPNNTSIDIIDMKWADPAQKATIEQTNTVKGRVLFEIDEKSLRMKPESRAYEARLTVETWDFNALPADPPTSTSNESLIINYDTTTTEVTEYRKFLILDNVHRIRVTVQSIEPQGLSDYPPLQVYAEIIVDREYNTFDCTTAPTFSNTTYSSVEDEVQVQWNNYPGAEAYELEWTFYDTLSEVGRHIRDLSTKTYGNFDWLFQNNATNIVTDQLNYNIKSMYASGYIFYRLRAIRHKDGQRVYTHWTTEGASGTLVNLAEKQQIPWHQPDLNWSSNLIFSEGGRFVPSIKYFDGSLRERQSIVVSNANQVKIIGETFYDYYGRPTINTLPVPDDVSILNMDYVPQFNQNGFGQSYNKTDFNITDCSSPAPTMSTASGAAQYYGVFDNSRPNIDQFLPDAEGFPFAHTEYMPDQTGRIKRQGGVGATFQMGSGHETQYFYGKPTQVELD